MSSITNSPSSSSSPHSPNSSTSSRSLFLARVRALDSPAYIPLLKGIKRGFEKECLRIDEQGFLSQTPHPKALGSSLTHPSIITDYSEALLEFVTPPSDNLDEPITVLNDIQHYTTWILAKELGKNEKGAQETLWVDSMPCQLPKEDQIPIAEYGHSNIGQLKNIYRRGLGYRYGRAMQTIAGIHYNFSLSDDFWRSYQALANTELSNTSVPISNFISDQYLRMLRNGKRWGWMLPFLFGASPAVCASFFCKKTDNLAHLERIGNHTLLGRYATSLRLSDLGYNSKIQALASISYNDFETFIHSMHDAVHTPVEQYEKIGVYRDGEYRQLNANILQIEDEHYAMFRPKRVALRYERTLAAMVRSGIEYVEVRAIDLNPFINIGIEKETVYFLDTFLLTCLLQDNLPLGDAENQRIGYNLSQIVLMGRQPGLMLQDEQGIMRSVASLGLEMIEQMLEVATLLDKAFGSENFTKACKKASDCFLNMDNLPSAKVVEEMASKQYSHFEFAWDWSKHHQADYLSKPLSAEKKAYFHKLAMDSLQEQTELEQSDTVPFNEFLAQYLEV